MLWDGVYAVEYRVHLTMNRLASTDLHVYSPTGSQLHIITSQWCMFLFFLCTSYYPFSVLKFRLCFEQEAFLRASRQTRFS